MKIALTQQYIKCNNCWESKMYGVVFVQQVEHIEPVFMALCEQDDYWEDYKNLIKVAPNELPNYNDIDRYCEYCGKTDIYDIPKLKEKLLLQGIEILLYQCSNYE